MTSLHVALKKAVDDLGMDILKSPMLVNILTDYRAFDVHDPMLKEKKLVIKSLVAENYYDKISEWRKKADTCWESKDSDWLNEFCKKTGLKRTVVGPIADAIKIAIGLKEASRDFSDLKGLFSSIKMEYLEALERLIQVHTDFLKIKTAYYPPEAETELYLLQGKLMILAKDPSEAKSWIDNTRLSIIQKHSTHPQIKKRKRSRFVAAVCISAIVLGLAVYIAADRISYSKNKSAIASFESNIANGDEALKNNDPETALSFYMEAEKKYTSDYHHNKYKKIASDKQEEAAQIVVKEYMWQITKALNEGKCSTAKDLYNNFLSTDFPECIDKKSEAEKFDKDIHQRVIQIRNDLLSSISKNNGKATSEEKATIEDLLYCYPDDYYLNMIKDKIK